MNRSQIRVAAAALNQTALDIDGNVDRIKTAIQMAAARDCHLLCLPELCVTGYGCEDVFLSHGFREDVLGAVSELIKTVGNIVVSIGFPLDFNGQIYNACALIANQKLLGIVPKQNLARDGLHYEPRWFRAWEKGRVESFNFFNQQVPIGDLIFEVDDCRIGFEICEDAWVEDRPVHRLKKRNANLILNPSASHFAFAKNDTRKQLIRDAVEAYDLGYVYANLLGNEAGRAIYEGDTYIAAKGEILKSGRRFSYSDIQLTTAEIDVPVWTEEHADPAGFGGESIETGFSWAENSKTFKDFSRPESQSSQVIVTPSLSASSPNNPTPTTANPTSSKESDWESGEYLKEEEFTRAVSLGLFDYVRKSRSRGVVVSLSGGADSAAVTCLSRLMLQLSIDDIGIENVQARLSYLKGIETATTLEQLAKHLLCTAYQSTQNSSDVTRDAANDVAMGNFTTHYELNVDDLVEGYKSIVADAIGRALNWETDDIALQNIQARTRSPSIWMFANIRNALLLSTSNRSEAAVGYATMDGDTSGGLAPIAGIDKAFLRHWLVWLETIGVEGVGPFPFLNSVNQQQPTAELRPLSSNQTDEDDLMPYPILDFIERAAVRDKLMPREIVELMCNEFTFANREQLVGWIKRFFQLWCRNQWKRERYAPSFHLDDESLDPKTWCRFPILSGGFANELSQLET